MTLQPFDERYNPLTGHWTCPCCLRRRESCDGQSDELGHLCEDCWRVVTYELPDLERVKASGLQWVSLRDGAWAMMVYGRCRAYVAFDYPLPGKWVATLCVGPGMYTNLEVGTLSDCAHALKEAVLGGNQ